MRGIVRAKTPCLQDPNNEPLQNEAGYIQGVSKRMTRIQIIISNNEKVLQLQNKLQIIK